jgi:hypothetical protein
MALIVLVATPAAVNAFGQFLGLSAAIVLGIVTYLLLLGAFDRRLLTECFGFARAVLRPEATADEQDAGP